MHFFLPSRDNLYRGCHRGGVPQPAVAERAWVSWLVLNEKGCVCKSNLNGGKKSGNAFLVMTFIFPGSKGGASSYEAGITIHYLALSTLSAPDFWRELNFNLDPPATGQNSQE